MGAVSLKPKHRRRRLGDFTSLKEPAVAARPKVEPSPKTYSGRVAIRLRSLRESRGWSVKELQEHLKAAGQSVPTSTIYAYELGSVANGVDLSWDLVPVYSKAFGFKTANGVLPPE